MRTGVKIPAISGDKFSKKLGKALRKSGIDFEITKKNRLIFDTMHGKHSVSIGSKNIQAGQIKEIVNITGINIQDII